MSNVHCLLSLPLVFFANRKDIKKNRNPSFELLSKEVDLPGWLMSGEQLGIDVIINDLKFSIYPDTFDLATNTLLVKTLFRGPSSINSEMIAAQDDLISLYDDDEDDFDSCPQLLEAQLVSNKESLIRTLVSTGWKIQDLT